MEQQETANQSLINSQIVSALRLPAADRFLAMAHVNTFWTTPLDFFLLQKKVKKIHDRKKMLNLVKQELL